MTMAMSACVSPATGTAEREAALAMLVDLPTGRRLTLGADKAYDVKEFVQQLREYPVTRLSLRTRPVAAVPWMAAPGNIPVMRSVNGRANAWSPPSADSHG